MGKHDFDSPAFPQQGGVAVKLTIANVALPAGKNDHIVFDQMLRGFGLRVRRLSGDVIRKYWIIQYRAHGRARRMNIGDAEKVTVAQARERARKELAKVELGGDPQGEKKERREKDSHSLRSAITEFLSHKSGKENTLRAARLYLEGDAYLGSLRSLPVDRITRRDLASRILAVSKANGVPTALGFRAQVSALFTWAMQTGLIEHNPLIGAFKPTRPEARDRVLSNAEIATIWRALDEDDDYGKCGKLLFLTGCRREEIGGMRRSEFSADYTSWTLPKGRSKNGMAHTLPVTPLMLEIIDSIPMRESGFLFGHKHGFTSWSRGKKTLDKRLELPPWSTHDIRRSVASGMGDIGILPHIVEIILNHQSGHKRGVAGIYNKSPYANDVVSAMLRWSDHVRSITEAGKAKVIALRAAAAT
jgi:integrase